ncbi:MAG: transporter [Phycisphaerales bacterium]|nr:transporter [Phycisphaerales bacterium]
MHLSVSPSRWRCVLLSAVAMWLAVIPAIGAQPTSSMPPDKSRFTLLDPTPRELMREMSTDRPDTTESPYTVDAGHVQLELSFFDYADDEETTTWTIAPLNLKLGLLNNTDLQFVFDPYTFTDVDDAGAGEGAGQDTEGIGNIALRLKQNLIGNDEGSIAFAVMPFVTFPSGDDAFHDDRIEGGLIFPLALELPAEFSLGLMAEVDWVRSDDGDGYATEFIHTAVLAHDLVGDLAGFIEYVGVSSSEATYTAGLVTGLTYQATDDWALDAGVRIGLSDASEDAGVFIGTSIRY